VGVFPPAMQASIDNEETNSLARHLLAQQTKPAILQFDVKEVDDAVQITVILQRADAVTGVLEVSREGFICNSLPLPLYNAGELPVMACQGKVHLTM
jgi:hypothetical protein